ncbi:DapH/DapD/GlmU-related protein [Tenacibaculum sp. SG-28]|uniref:acyltransferase n=1 Tax=Tenacibaculum sp. SG-28 TaxID=754426 RepID=UPI000CF462FD|nr:acyltransferase [Tenacibaculum sp. SG-28]PQJ21097.1 hypothetical protein BSU00_08780 [Tenacibaculum sp. SG-28]
MKYLYKLLWIPFKVLEKIYWFLWRKEQLSNFQTVGNDVRISKGCFFHNKNISIGNKVYIGQKCRFQASLSHIFIGNNIMFGPEVSIHGGNHRTDLIGRFMIDIKLEEKLPENDEDIIIEDDVWIGARAIILKGVKIGQGSIIGAGVVVSKSIPPYSIITGNRSQKIRERWTEDQIKEHKTKLK